MPPETELQPFDVWLTQQRRGALNDELTAGLHELVEKVTLLGRKGTLTLRIDVKANDSRIVIVTDEVVVKPPKEDRPGAVWFVDGESNLFRSDPAQGAFHVEEEESVDG